jgi:hypothetical protein
MSLENYLNNIQEKKLDTKLEQSSTKMDVVISTKKIIQESYSPRRRVSVVRDFPSFCGSNAPSLNNK